MSSGRRLPTDHCRSPSVENAALGHSTQGRGRRSGSRRAHLTRRSLPPLRTYSRGISGVAIYDRSPRVRWAAHHPPPAISLHLGLCFRWGSAARWGGGRPGEGPLIEIEGRPLTSSKLLEAACTYAVRSAQRRYRPHVGVGPYAARLSVRLTTAGNIRRSGPPRPPESP